MRDVLFDQSAHANNPIHSLDARSKILVLFSLIIISVSTHPSALFSFAGYASFLLLLTLLARVPIGLLVKRFAIALPFVLVVGCFLPFVEQKDLSDPHSTGWWLFWNLVVKALVGIYALSLLTATTRFNQLIEGFSRLKVPALFLMLFSFTYRYLFVLVEEAGRMKRARDARAYGGQWLWQARVIGQMIGTLFLRSYERGERVYLAMCSRGYDGSQSLWPMTPGKLRGRDYLFTVSSLLLMVGARWGMS